MSSPKIANMLHLKFKFWSRLCIITTPSGVATHCPTSPEYWGARAPAPRPHPSSTHELWFIQCLGGLVATLKLIPLLNSLDLCSSYLSLVEFVLCWPLGINSTYICILSTWLIITQTKPSYIITYWTTKTFIIIWNNINSDNCIFNHKNIHNYME